MERINRPREAGDGISGDGDSGKDQRQRARLYRCLSARRLYGVSCCLRA